MNGHALLAGVVLFALPTAGTSYAAALRSHAPAGSPVYRPSAARIPACAHAGKAVSFPQHFPASFPVPSGTAITGKRVPIGGGIAATGFVPMHSFAATVHFIPTQLPKVGFTVLHLEIDTPHDSEGSYQGHGYVGGWSLRAISGCAAMVFQVSAKTNSKSKFADEAKRRGPNRILASLE
ncbi:MAG TPA: hypothetical protein VF898_08150 [Chloroflexota bacterium]